MSKKSISLTDESGQTMAEYAFVLSVITAIIVTSLALLSGAVGKAVDLTTTLIKSLT